MNDEPNLPKDSKEKKIKNSDLISEESNVKKPEYNKQKEKKLLKNNEIKYQEDIEENEKKGLKKPKEKPLKKEPSIDKEMKDSNDLDKTIRVNLKKINPFQTKKLVKINPSDPNFAVVVQLKQIAEIKDKKYTKQIKIEESLKENMEEIKKLKEDLEFKSEQDPYVKEIGKQYGGYKSFVKDLTKELPANMAKITPEEGFSQYLIENNLTNEENFYNFLHSSQELLLEQTQYLWSQLSIPEKVTEKGFSAIQKKMMQDLKDLKDIHGIDIFSDISATLPCPSTIDQAIYSILYSYTGSGYLPMNKALTSKNPLILKKLAYFVNVIAFNNKKVLKGQKFDSQGTIKVYRNIFLRRDLLKLYSVNQLLYFTHLTSTSKKHIFKNPSTNTHVNVEFQINLLNVQQYEKLEFFTGIYVNNISAYKGEKEILLTPYQLFFIKGITHANNEVLIELDEIDNKDLINQIMSVKTEQENVNKEKQININNFKEFLVTKEQNINVEIKNSVEEKKKNRGRIQN